MPSVEQVAGFETRFGPAPELAEWATASFVADGAPLWNPDHEHLRSASIGFFWTNVSNAKKGRMVIPVKLLGDTLALGLMNGTAIRANDRREMMAAEGTTPTPADQLRIGSSQYAFIRAEPFAPGSVALFYDLILRV